MTQAPPKLVTFEEFIDWLPESGVRYELHTKFSGKTSVITMIECSEFKLKI